MQNWVKKLFWYGIFAPVAFAFQVALYVFLGRDPVEIVGDKVKMFYFEPTFLVYAGVLSGVAALLAGLVDLKYDWTGQLQRKFNKSLKTVESVVLPRDWDIQDAIEWWERFANKKKEEDGIEFIDTLSQLVQDGVEDGGITVWGRPNALHHSWEKIDKGYWKNNRIEPLAYFYATNKDAVRDISTHPKVGADATAIQYFDLRVTSTEIKKKWPKESKRIPKSTPNYVPIEQAIDHVMGFLFPDWDKSHQDYQHEIPLACEKIVEKLRGGELVARGKRTEYKKDYQKYIPHSTDSNRIFDKKDWEYRELIPIASMVPHNKVPQTTSSGSDEDHIQLTALKVDLNTVKTLWPVENT